MAVSSKLARAFARALQRHAVTSIEQAGGLDPPRRLNIRYHKKTTGEVVEREIRPYEIKSLSNGALACYATDTLHGAGQIHSFLVDRILSVSEPRGRFKPYWEVKLGVE